MHRILKITIAIVLLFNNGSYASSKGRLQYALELEHTWRQLKVAVMTADTRATNKSLL